MGFPQWLRLVLATIAGVGLLPAQSNKPMAFDVASVKKVDKGERLTLSPVRNGGTIHWVTGRPVLILYAFHLQNWQVSGLDMDYTWYQIDAKTDPEASEDQIRQMLQTLLAERFKLAVHRETRDLAGYALTVAKTGLKLKAVADDEKALPMPEYWSYQEKFASSFEGRALVTIEGQGTMALTARRVTMRQVAEALQDTLHSFVRDDTKLSGKYYLGVEFANPNGASEGTALPDALRDTVGLRLDKQRGPVELLVIDHIEKVPVEN